MAELTLRDAIVSALTAPHLRQPPLLWVQVDDADLVLAMPEMQAIRSAMLGMAQSLAAGCNDDVNHGKAVGTAREWVDEWMPEGCGHVVAWVMDGDAVSRRMSCSLTVDAARARRR